MTKTIAIHITGKVQGVFFRQATREQAIALGITGVVQNLEDGSVHIIATGEELQLQQLVNWCHQGPPKARVEEVKVNNEESQTFETFKVDRT